MTIDRNLRIGIDQDYEKKPSNPSEALQHYRGRLSDKGRQDMEMFKKLPPWGAARIVVLPSGWCGGSGDGVCSLYRCRPR